MKLAVFTCLLFCSMDSMAFNCSNKAQTEATAFFKQMQDEYEATGHLDKLLIQEPGPGVMNFIYDQILTDVKNITVQCENNTSILQYSAAAYDVKVVIKNNKIVNIHTNNAKTAKTRDIL